MLQSPTFPSRSRPEVSTSFNERRRLREYDYKKRIFVKVSSGQMDVLSIFQEAGLSLFGCWIFQEVHR